MAKRLEHTIASVMMLVVCTVDRVEGGLIARLITYLPVEGFISPDECEGCGNPKDCACIKDFVVRGARNAESSDSAAVPLTSMFDVTQARVLTVPPHQKIPTHGDPLVEEHFLAIEKEMGL